jgi:MFS family permease
VTAAVFVASVAVTANRFKVPPVLPVLMNDLQVDTVTAGWLMSISSLAGVLLAIPAALLLARIGLKRTGLIALGCAAAGAAVGALAGSATTMLLGRAIEGISVSLMAVLAPTTISLWFPPRARALPMGIWATWVPVGNVLMFNVAHPLQKAFGWRAVWGFGALLAFAALLLVGLVVAPPPRSDKERDNPPASPGTPGRLLRSPATWLLGLAFGTFGFSVLAYNTWAPTYLIDTLHVQPDTANAYASLMFLAAIPSSVGAGWLIDRLEHRYRLLPVAFALTTLLFFWSLRLGSVGVVVPYMIGLGLASNVIPAATFTLAPETMPRVEFVGLALAIVMFGSYTGSLTGPPALGAIVAGGNWQAGSLCLVAVMGLGTLLSWYVARRCRAA